MQRKGGLLIKLPLSIAPSQTTVTKALINGGAFASSEETFLCREKKTRNRNAGKCVNYEER